MVHTLKLQGYSIRAIARMTGLNRRTITKRLKEEELKPYKERICKSKLDDFKGYVEHRIKKALPDRIPSSVIYEEILEMGYNGKIRILQTFIKSVYEKAFPSSKNEEVIRFETPPGLQAQCDWTTLRKGKDPLYAFVMVLGYSRFAYVSLTDNMKQETFQECTKKAFEYFGGIPKTILYDNLKSVVIQRDKYGKNQHGFNENFLDFAKTYKFIPKICKPYRAQTKGKVERFIDYFKGNFYRPLKAKLQESGINIDKELLNNHLSSWLIKANNRVHKTTKEKPIKLLDEEKSYLIPLESIVSIEEAKQTNKEKPTNAYLTNNIDISYFTTLNDYEQLLT